MGTFWMAVLAFFVVIGPLILIHEFGHFVGARLTGVPIEEFGIGYPPRLVKLFERNGTAFTLNVIPLGGFVRPLGEDDPEVEGGLAASSKLTRIIVLSAGAVANAIAGYILLVVMFMVGAPFDQPGALITDVVAGSPAAQAGLEIDDVILRADDVAIERYDMLSDYTHSHEGQPIMFTVQRGEEMLAITLTPLVDPPPGQWPVGIRYTSVTEIRQFGFFGALEQAAIEIGDLAVRFVRLPIEIFRNQIELRFLRPVSVVGMSQLGGMAIDQSITRNALWPVLELTAFISIALALTNILPIPAFDGGRILFVLIEAVRGQRVDPQRETLIHYIGFMVLLGLMLVFVYLDIVDPLF
jgi:regulator of sigma E protease